MVINDNGIFGAIITAFVGIIIGLSFFTSITDTTGSLTGTFTGTNTSFAGVANTSVEIIDADLFAITELSEVRNITGIVMNESIHYNFTLTTNNITVFPPTGTYFADYTYQTVDYIDDNAARSITNLIPIFFALAIMGAAFIAVKFDMFSGKDR